ncbi:hypothetical protein H0H92_006533 [Tricholoma furcatifolium]|nr:hypothetical protein H0H92_006533 [Tricholoma furcatifolium]
MGFNNTALFIFSVDYPHPWPKKEPNKPSQPSSASGGSRTAGATHATVAPPTDAFNPASEQVSFVPPKTRWNTLRRTVSQMFHRRQPKNTLPSQARPPASILKPSQSLNAPKRLRRSSLSSAFHTGPGDACGERDQSPLASQCRGHPSQRKKHVRRSRSLSGLPDSVLVSLQNTDGHSHRRHARASGRGQDVERRPRPSLRRHNKLNDVGRRMHLDEEMKACEMLEQLRDMLTPEPGEEEEWYT